MNKPMNYNSIHSSLRWKYGAAPECVFCDEPTSRFEWANVTGNYTKDIEDYLPMCKSHHVRFDYDPEVTREKFIRNATGNRWGIISLLCEAVDGTVVEFGSAMDARRITGVLQTGISNCLAGRAKTAGGYRWSRGVLF